jgi:hypothetical protein
MRWSFLQGLEVCSAGRALARPHRLELEQWVEEQIGWAASSEKTSAQYLEAFAFRRGKAIEGAGRLLFGSVACHAQYLCQTF